MIEQRLTQHGHTRRFIIEHASPEGWVVEEELDSEVLNRRQYKDWHRVERAVRMQVSVLEQHGWDLQQATV